MPLSKVNRPGLNTGIADSSDATAVTIDSSERVGIGKSSSITDKLHIENTGANCLLSVARTDGAAGRLVMQHTSSVGALQTTGSVPLTFGTADTERLRIDASGRVTTPSQPDFWTDKTNGSQTLNSSTKITFNGIRRNNGSHYSTSNSRFTAPVTGRYFFCFNAVFDNTSNNNVRVAEMGFLKNNAHRYGFSSLAQENWNASNEHPAVNTTDIIYLDTNDYVEVYTFSHWDSGGGTFAVRNGAASFSGYFLG